MCLKTAVCCGYFEAHRNSSGESCVSIFSSLSNALCCPCRNRASLLVPSILYKQRGSHYSGHIIQRRGFIHARRVLNDSSTELFTLSLILKTDGFTIGDRFTKDRRHYLEFLCSLFADLPPLLSACDLRCIHVAILTMQVRKS